MNNAGQQNTVEKEQHIITAMTFLAKMPLFVRHNQHDKTCTPYTFCYAINRITKI